MSSSSNYSCIDKIEIITLSISSIEEMTHAVNDNRKSQDDNSGYFVCWGCGEFGQHCHDNKQEVTFQDGVVEKFCGHQSGRVKHVACGSSHTVVVTSKFRRLTI